MRDHLTPQQHRGAKTAGACRFLHGLLLVVQVLVVLFVLEDDPRRRIILIRRVLLVLVLVVVLGAGVGYLLEAIDPGMGGRLLPGAPGAPGIRIDVGAVEVSESFGRGEANRRLRTYRRAA